MRVSVCVCSKAEDAERDHGSPLSQTRVVDIHTTWQEPVVVNVNSHGVLLAPAFEGVSIFFPIVLFDLFWSLVTVSLSHAHVRGVSEF